MFFTQLSEVPPDPVFGLAASAQKDPHGIDLVVGVYRNPEGNTAIFPSVLKAKQAIFSQDVQADYLPIDGMDSFCQAVGPLLFGLDEWEVLKERTYVAQSLGGTGALRALGEFVCQWVGTTISLPDPTWANHAQIFSKAQMKIVRYPYLSSGQTQKISWDPMIAYFKKLPPKSSVLFHASCHNPSGVDPSLQEWKHLSDLVHEYRLFPIFDCAYQGLGKGLSQDVAPIALFAKEGHDMAIGYSCSKNFSLYSQRIGALLVVSQSPDEKKWIASHLKQILRASYSNPPAHGARIVSYLLTHPERTLWEQDLQAVRTRLQELKHTLSQSLPPHFSTSIQESSGLFMMLPLTFQEIRVLREEYHVYILESGRVNVSGLNEKNLFAFTKAVNAVVS